MEIKWAQLLFQLINFSILIFVLNRFLYRPILKIIEARNKKIEDSIRAAEESLKEKEKLAELKKQAQAEAREEAVKIVEAARKQADSAGREILAGAQAEAEAVIGKKMVLMEDRLRQEEKRLRQRLGGLVVSATKQLLASSLTAKDQRRLLSQRIKLLEKAA